MKEAPPLLPPYSESNKPQMLCRRCCAAHLRPQCDSKLFVRLQTNVTGGLTYPQQRFLTVFEQPLSFFVVVVYIFDRRRH